MPCGPSKQESTVAVRIFSCLSLMLCGPVRLICRIRSGFKFQFFCLLAMKLLIRPEDKMGKTMVVGSL